MASAPAVAAADYPWAKRIAAAKRYADGRAGVVSFAVVDERGKLRGDHTGRVHHSASVVKAMLLAAYLRQGDVRDRALARADRRLLGPMVKRSNNRTASIVYSEVGPDALYALAEAADMKHFSTQSVWGLTEITAADQARFFQRFERYVPRRHRDYALRLLARIVRRQRWGIPPVAPDGWKVHFKGGWTPASEGGWRINQVATLRRSDRRLSLAILTRRNPGKRYGTRTVRGVARRLLRGYARVSR